MTEKKKIAVMCGGMSGEHEISLISAYSVYNNIDRGKYTPFYIGISKNGDFVTHENLVLKPEDPRTVHINPAAVKVNKDLSTHSPRPDIVFSIIHGTYGEDGCLQGFFRILNIPFVGGDVYASALCMNKSATKKILHHAGIPVCKFREITRNEAVPSYQAISRELGAVVFVKPNCLGSSVGISKCRNEAEYLKGVEEAFLYDTKVLIEEDFSGREIEFAVMGNHTVAVSPPGEIVPDREFYSYDSKYDPASKTDLKVPTQLPPDLLKEMTVCAEKAYRETECQGLCRVDFLLKSDGRYVVNELNTLPGFTKISMFPALFKLTGRSYSEIIGRLIELAEERHRESAGLRRNFI